MQLQLVIKSVTSVLLICLILTGCRSSEDSNSGGSASSSDNASSAVEKKPDDPAAVAALEEAKFGLVKDAAGLVVEVSAASDSDV